MRAKMYLVFGIFFLMAGPAAFGADCRAEIPGLGKVVGFGDTSLVARENASLTCGLKLQQRLGHSLSDDEKDEIIDTCVNIKCES